MNPYLGYYLEQVQYGGALGGFAGVRTPHRGRGFLGRMFSGIGSFIKDLIPSLGKRALPSAINLAQDVLSGQNLAESAKKRFKEAGKNIADETLDKLKSKIHSGSGIRSRILKQRQLLKFLKSSPKKRRSKRRSGRKKKNYKRMRKTRKLKRKHV